MTRDTLGGKIPLGGNTPGGEILSRAGSADRGDPLTTHSRRPVRDHGCGAHWQGVWQAGPPPRPPLPHRRSRHQGNHRLTFPWAGRWRMGAMEITRDEVRRLVE